MYPSVGNVVASRSSWVRGAAARRPATSSLNTLTLVLSATTTWPGAAPINGAIRSPIRAGASHQPLASHDPINSSPHCRRTTSSTRAGTVRPSAPSELPSR